MSLHSCDFFFLKRKKRHYLCILSVNHPSWLIVSYHISFQLFWKEKILRIIQTEKRQKTFSTWVENRMLSNELFQTLSWKHSHGGKAHVHFFNLIRTHRERKTSLFQTNGISTMEMLRKCKVVYVIAFETTDSLFKTWEFQMLGKHSKLDPGHCSKPGCTFPLTGSLCPQLTAGSAPRGLWDY